MIKTIEEKAKAYDRALEKIHQFIDGYSRREISKEELEDIFSELAESEDERIKHEIKVVLANTDLSQFALEYTFADMLAWLEKQAEKNYVTTEEDEKVKKAIKQMYSFLPNEPTYIGDVQVKDIFAWLEKQGKQDARYKYLEELLEADTIYQMAVNDAMVEEAKTKAIEAISNMDIWDLLDPKKQGEQKANYTTTVETGDRSINALVTRDIPFGAKDSELQEVFYHIPEGFHAEIDGNKVVIKKGEQKPIDYNEELKKCRENPLYFFDKYVKIKPKEQNLAWNEEDEEMCQETIDWFEKKCFPYALESENPARKSIKWLKSLKQRIKGE